MRRVRRSKLRFEPLAVQHLMMLRAQTGITPFGELLVPWTRPRGLDRSAAERFVSKEPDSDVAMHGVGWSSWTPTALSTCPSQAS